MGDWGGGKEGRTGACWGRTHKCGLGAKGIPGGHQTNDNTGGGKKKQKKRKYDGNVMGKMTWKTARSQGRITLISPRTQGQQTAQEKLTGLEDAVFGQGGGSQEKKEKKTRRKNLRLQKWEKGVEA